MNIEVVKMGELYGVKFNYGVQYFTLEYKGSKKEAEWMVKMLKNCFDCYTNDLTQQIEPGAIIKGRLSVLTDFDSICASDAFVGFTADEWKAVKKFFEFNKVISGWDK